MNKFFSSEKNFNFIMTLGVLLILAIPVGIANIVLGYIIGESPCTLCWFERTGMILVGVLGIFILRYGPRLRYLVSLVFVCGFGLYMTLRHTGNLIALDHGQGFGDSIMGAHTYSWGVFVFWVVVFAIGLVLLFLRKENSIFQDLVGSRKSIKPFTKFTTVVVGLSFFIILSNAFQAFLENGVPPFSGKGRPARFTLDISKASQDWTPSVWKRVLDPWSLRGPENIEFPYVAGVSAPEGRTFNTDAKAGPIPTEEKPLKLISTTELPFEAKGCNGNGVVTGVAFNQKQNKFAFLTNNAGIYYTDPEFKKVTDYGILDKPNGNDIKMTVDATFMNNQLIGLAHNKTIWASELKDPSKIDPWWQWRIFRESSPQMAPVWKFNRPWLATARAKMSFVASGAYDPKLNELHLVTVPNNRNKNTIISTFDMKDKQVVAERNLTSDRNSSKKPLDYYIVGSTFHNGKLYSVSKNYNSLLVIDPVKAKVERVYGLPKMADPHSVEYKDGSLYILGLEGGKNKIYKVEAPAD